MRLLALGLILCVPSITLAQLSDSEMQKRMAELNAKAAAQRVDDVASTQPAARSPEISPGELLAQGITAMRSAQWPKAIELLNRSYRATPPTEVGRALIINRAIVDFVQGSNCTRAVKDLSAYLAAHPDDEEAVDLLGAAGHKAIVRNPKFANATLCIEAGHRLESCVSALESKRPGLRKWGAKWMTAQQFASIQDRQRECQIQLDSAMADVQRAQASLAQARSNGASANVISTGTAYAGGHYGYDNVQEERSRRISAANDEISRAQAVLDAANARADAVRARFPQPVWPDVFQPVDPAAPATTQPATPK